MAFGLENMMIINGSELTDRADEISIRQRTSTGLEWPGEEIIEALVAANVRVRRFVHVDTVFADESAD